MYVSYSFVESCPSPLYARADVETALLKNLVAYSRGNSYSIPTVGMIVACAFAAGAVGMFILQRQNTRGLYTGLPIIETTEANPVALGPYQTSIEL